MKDRYFIDTNILVYTFDQHSPKKQKKALEIVGAALQLQEGFISYQVMQEFLNVALQKFKSPLSLTDASDYLNEILLPLCEVYPSPALYQSALRIKEKTKYRFYDALIIASAVEGKSTTIYSEDLEPGRLIEGVSIKNPF